MPVVSDIQMHLNNRINILLNYILQLISTGCHSCLWCTIIDLEMTLPRDKRSPTILRTLENLVEQHQKFLDAGGEIKKAKNYFNVISPWARTLKSAIWYQNEGQILTLIFNNIDSCRLFWRMITMPNE